MRKLFAATTSLGLAVLALASGAVAVEKTAPGAWIVDTPHTEINFTVTHFFTPVTGSFQDYEVDLVYDPADPAGSSVEARIAVASVDTGNEKRDNHLRSADWFEADKYPYITFRSTSVRADGADRLVATGDLTIKGETRQVELPIRLLGVKAIPEQMREMLGGTEHVASFKAGATIDRGDFGVGVGSWAATLIVGGQVDIEILLEAHRR